MEQAEKHDAGLQAHWAFAIVPLSILVVSVPLVVYLIGSESFFPFTFDKYAVAYGEAEKFVPQIMVISALLATAAAAFAYLFAKRSRSEEGSEAKAVHSVFLSGVRDLSQPVLILVAAWMLGAVVSPARCC